MFSTENIFLCRVLVGIGEVLDRSSASLVGVHNKSDRIPNGSWTSPGGVLNEFQQGHGQTRSCPNGVPDKSWASLGMVLGRFRRGPSQVSGGSQQGLRQVPSKSWWGPKQVTGKSWQGIGKVLAGPQSSPVWGPGEVPGR